MLYFRLHDLHRSQANYHGIVGADYVDYDYYHRFGRVEKRLAKLEKVSNPPPERTRRWVFVLVPLQIAPAVTLGAEMINGEQRRNERQARLRYAGRSGDFVWRHGGEL
jgi:hypothetical protein